MRGHYRCPADISESDSAVLPHGWYAASAEMHQRAALVKGTVAGRPYFTVLVEMNREQFVLRGDSAGKGGPAVSTISRAQSSSR